jgi:ribonuclease Y
MLEPVDPGMSTTTVVALAGACAVGGALAGALAARFIGSRSLRVARQQATAIVETAHAEALASAKGLELEAERRIAERRAQIDREIDAALAQLRQGQDALRTTQQQVDARLAALGERERRLDERDQRVNDREREASTTLEHAKAALTEREAALADLRRQLEAIAGLTRDEAMQRVLDDARRDSEHEAAHVRHALLSEAERSAREQGREITLMAIQRYAGETVGESTVRTVKVPNEEIKGRLIGREGRNIRALEKATGADLLIDDTPGVIAVSCFDRVRQAIAVEALQRLVADGRVHPARIEDVVAQVRRDMEQRITKAGEEAALEADVRNLHPRVIEALGRLSFRTSYAQNVLRHSIEVAFLSQMIADQLGLDGRLARRCGLLHDLGKAMDHEMEGGHPAIGRDFLVRHGERNEAVLNAVAGHHGDIPSTTPYTPIVMAADALSGARPGARRESMEQYVKRLQQLEAIAREHAGVTEAFAVQAGREVRVIVDAGSVDDARTRAIADSIAARVEREMTFPGEIKVSVLREVRAEASAR